MADPKRDGYAPPVMDSSEPTTVLGWLETLPKNLKDHSSTLFIRDFRGSKWACKNLCDAISVAIGNCTELLPQEVTFLGGVQCFLWEYPAWEVSDAVRLGYNAAKAAFEPAEQSPYQVAYIAETPNTPISSVTPDYLAELQRKAAEYDQIVEIIKLRHK